jgi:hypothetical protein
MIGVPELIILLVGSVFGIVPIVGAIWALVMLYGIRGRQDEILRKLDAVERSVQAGRSV